MSTSVELYKILDAMEEAEARIRKLEAQIEAADRLAEAIGRYAKSPGGPSYWGLIQPALTAYREAREGEARTHTSDNAEDFLGELDSPAKPFVPLSKRYPEYFPNSNKGEARTQECPVCDRPGCPGVYDGPIVEARTQPDESAFHAGWGRAQSGQFDEPRDAYEDYKAASREARTQADDALKRAEACERCTGTAEIWDRNYRVYPCPDCQPETGQPDRYLYDAGYGAGVRDTEARIVALIEGEQIPLDDPPSGPVTGYRAAINTILTAIQEDTDAD